MKRICVFCGSSISNNRAYLAAAADIGTLLAEKGIEIVYGGADVGLMGALSMSALLKGGRVIGVMPEHLIEMGVARKNLTELKVVGSMHERKALMNELSDAFIVLPGGVGTLEESFEVFTWMQLGLHEKGIAFLNTEGFYDRLFDFLRHVSGEGFLRREHLDMLIVDDNPESLIEKTLTYQHTRIEKWFDKEKNRV